MTVSPIYSFMLDNVGGFIEFDVKPPQDPALAAGDWSTVSRSGAIDARCPQTKPIRIINCLGHLHIGMALTEVTQCCCSGNESLVDSAIHILAMLSCQLLPACASSS